MTLRLRPAVAGLRRDACISLPAKEKRVRGIEPPCAAWEAAILPLNYTRERICDCRFQIFDCKRVDRSGIPFVLQMTHGRNNRVGWVGILVYVLRACFATYAVGQA